MSSIHGWKVAEKAWHTIRQRYRKFSWKRCRRVRPSTTRSYQNIFVWLSESSQTMNCGHWKGSPALGLQMWQIAPLAANKGIGFSVNKNISWISPQYQYVLIVDQVIINQLPSPRYLRQFAQRTQADVSIRSFFTSKIFAPRLRLPANVCLGKTEVQISGRGLWSRSEWWCKVSEWPTLTEWDGWNSRCILPQLASPPLIHSCGIVSYEWNWQVVNKRSWETMSIFNPFKF